LEQAAETARRKAEAEMTAEIERGQREADAKVEQDRIAEIVREQAEAVVEAIGARLHEEANK
jgi:hypothetical protein